MIVTPLGFLTANRNVEGPHQGRDYLYGRITDQGVRIDAEAVKMLYHRLEVQGEACRISGCSAYEGCWGLIKAFPITNNVELLCSFAQQSSNCETDIFNPVSSPNYVERVASSVHK